MCDGEQTDPAAPFRVAAVDGLRLSVDETPVAWQDLHAADIDRFWADHVVANPTLWDGRTHFVTEAKIEDGIYRATCHAARFAALLHWRHVGYPPLGFRTIFGNVIPVTSDGAVLLGRMAAHTANGGMLYFPGGAFDGADVHAGEIDAAGGIARECVEEMGLAAPEIDWDGGYVICENEIRVSVNRIARLPWAAKDAKARILREIAGQQEPELVEICVIRLTEEAETAGAEPYAIALVRWLAAKEIIWPDGAEAAGAP